MSKRIRVGLRLPGLVEEMPKMERAGIDDMLTENTDQAREGDFNLRSTVNAAQVCVGFENVKMIVHRLLLVQILLAESDVLSNSPVAVARLEIPPMGDIMAVPFDESEQLLRPLQRRGVPRR